MSNPSGNISAVAIGGGTGLPVVLDCLLSLGYGTSAVVTMADDGGSTGVLRDQLGMLPPGDIRNCLLAMAAEPTGVLASLFRYRFPRGAGLEGHSLGNLIIAALADKAGSFSDAIEAAGELLHIRGRVLPSTLEDVTLHAIDADGRPVQGQATIAFGQGPIRSVYMEPEHPAPNPPALDAIRSADLVVIGPGSLFTSLIPNFLVDGVAEALAECSGKRVYVCNVANQRGETRGMDAADHVMALMEHGLSGSIDAVVVHPTHAGLSSHDRPLLCDDVDDAKLHVSADSAVASRIEAMGIRVIAADVRDETHPLHHDPGKLRAVLGEVL